MPRSGKAAPLFELRSDGLTVAVSGPADVTTYGVGSETLDISVPSGNADVWKAPEASVFDGLPYTVQIASERPVTVFLGDRSLDITLGSHRNIYFGTARVTFSQVGWAELSIPEHGVTARIRVSSRKLDYDTDYRLMVQGLESKARGLTVRLLSRTVDALTMTEEPSDVWAFWVSILTKLWAHLRDDIQASWHALPPHLQPHDEMVEIGRLKRPIGRDARVYARMGNSRIPARPLRWTTLSPERLYLLQLLAHISRRLDRLVTEVPDVGTLGQVNQIAQSVGALLSRFSSMVYLEGVLGEPVIPQTPRAQANPALRRVTFWHRQLNRGLFPEAGQYYVGPKDIHKLYEYWCYLTIVELLVEESGGILEIEPRVTRSPGNVTLGAGRGMARVRLAHGEIIRVHYEPRYEGLPTVAQEPDNVVELDGQRAIMLFDAKYRFEPNHAVIQAYSGGEMPIPPIDTINTMHQYHDAIVTPDPSPVRRVDRAIVIFPLPARHQPSWIHHRFYCSIERVGVGAIPLTPRGSDQYLREQIRHYLTVAAGPVAGSSVPQTGVHREGS